LKMVNDISARSKAMDKRLTALEKKFGIKSRQSPQGGRFAKRQ
jgi:hypothetical protein